MCGRSRIPEGGTIVATSTQSPFQATWAEVPVGVHTVVAVATDNQGTETFSNTVTISVLPPGETPGGWTPIAKVWDEPSGFWFVDAKRGWTVGRTGAILHTVDGGATWISQSSQAFQDVDLGKVQFVDAHRGWAIGNIHHVGGGTLLRTTDGGATWTRFSFDVGLNAFSFVDADVGWVVGGDGLQNGSVLFGTKDGGVTWMPLPGLPDTGIRTVQFVDRQNGWILASVVAPEGFLQDVLLHTSDGGLTWTEQLRAKTTLENPYSDGFSAMDFVDAKTGWVARSRQTADFSKVINNGLLATSDGGGTWTEQAFEESDAIFALDFVSSKQGWGAGAGTIIHTEDGGQSWVTQYRNITGIQGFVNVQFIDANRGWVLDIFDPLLKTTTGGKAP